MATQYAVVIENDSLTLDPIQLEGSRVSIYDEDGCHLVDFNLGE